MKSSRFEIDKQLEDIITKNVRNLFRIKKKQMTPQLTI